MPSSRLFGLAVVALLIAAPAGLPAFAMTLLTELVILGLFAMSLDLMVGYTRLVSFGHVAAYGLGAYASGYILLNSPMPLPFVTNMRPLSRESATDVGYQAVGIEPLIASVAASRSETALSAARAT